MFLYMVRLNSAYISACSTDAKFAGATTVVIEGGCSAIDISQSVFDNTAASPSLYCIHIRMNDFTSFDDSIRIPAQCQFSQLIIKNHKNGVFGEAGLDITFSNCQINGTLESGVVITPGQVVCDGWNFVACRFEQCGLHGAIVYRTSTAPLVLNIAFVGCDFISNNVHPPSGSGLKGNGITLGDGGTAIMTGGVRIVGCRLFNRASFTSGIQEFGIFVTNACDNFIIIDNDVRGNHQQTGIMNMQGTSSTRVVKDNLLDVAGQLP
jgi:hypothetical protein